MSAERIAYKNVSKRYPRSKRLAVDGVSLSVNPGEILALVGESGSGKTTLLRLAAGLEEPTGGELFIDGVRVAGGRDWVPPERRRLGMVFQEGALFPHLNIFGNVSYGLAGYAASARRNRTGEMLELVGLSGYEARFPHELSGGERQRVALARAMAPRPAVVFLDEPFSSLDTTLRRDLRDQVCGILKASGATAILVVHDPEDALSVGERVAVLRSGVLEQVSSGYDAYYNPSCEYCALLFGPANAVNAPGGARWLRPEQFRLCPAGSAAAARVRVLRVRDAGRVCEVWVQSPESPSRQWLLHADPKAPPRPGSEVGVLWGPS